MPTHTATRSVLGCPGFAALHSSLPHSEYILYCLRLIRINAGSFVGEMVEPN